MKEIVELRTSTTKHFDIGGGRIQMQSFRQPIHYRDHNGRWRPFDMNIENGRVWRCPYDVLLFPEFIGYIGKGPNGQHLELELLLPFVEPRIEGNRAVYPDVAPSTDFEILFLPHAIVSHRILKGPDAPKSVQYRLVRPVTQSAKPVVTGFDSKENRLEMRISEEPSGGLKQEGVTCVFQTQTWTGRVAVMDPKTRKRDWSEEVFYPVRID